MSVQRAQKKNSEEILNLKTVRIQDLIRLCYINLQNGTDSLFLGPVPLLTTQRAGLRIRKWTRPFLPFSYTKILSKIGICFKLFPTKQVLANAKMGGGGGGGCGISLKP
jgi:hypothetical protein